MCDLDNYSISKIMPIVSSEGATELQIMFEVHHSKTSRKVISISMKEYRTYRKPTSRHMVEPDGNVFVCKERFKLAKCIKHNKPMGCKFKLGITDEFIHRSKIDLDHCRCYCVLATQYAFDKWCYNDCIKNKRPLDDNAKIYKRLTM